MPPMWQIIINGPGYFNTSYDLPEGSTTLGRADDNDIVLSGDLVSRRHAVIAVQGETVTFKDMGSRNGSKLRGEVVRGEVSVREGDLLTVGENSLSLLRPTSPVTTTEERSVRYFGGGSDIREAVLYRRDIRDSYLVRALDNVPFEPVGDDSPPPSPASYENLIFLYRAAERLSMAPNLRDFLEVTIDELLSRLNGTTAVVLLRNNGGGPMVPAVVRHSQALPEGEVPVSDAIINQALEQGSSLAVEDVQSDRRFSQQDSVLTYGASQVLCVPLGMNEPFMGVLYINRMSERDAVELGERMDLCCGVGYLLVTALQKFETRENTDEALRLSLERYLPPDVAAKKESELRSQFRTRSGLFTKNQCTVLVGDLAGLSGLAEELSPDSMAAVLSDFYAQMKGIIFSFKGAVAPWTTCCVMGVFGYPYERPDDTIRAVRAALAMRAAWPKIRERHQNALPVDLRVGVSTGPLTIGTVPTGQGLELSAVGNSVNLAGWLAEWAMPGQVLVTDSVLEPLGGRFETTPHGSRTLKEGLSKVSVFEVGYEDVARHTKPGSR